MKITTRNLINGMYQRVIKSVDVWCDVATFTLTTWPRSLYPFPCETQLNNCVCVFEVAVAVSGALRGEAGGGCEGEMPAQ